MQAKKRNNISSCFSTGFLLKSRRFCLLFAADDENDQLKRRVRIFSPNSSEINILEH
jgi:hypothetical protein